jgi:hypothetical protein
MLVTKKWFTLVSVPVKPGKRAECKHVIKANHKDTTSRQQRVLGISTYLMVCGFIIHSSEVNNTIFYSFFYSDENDSCKNAKQQLVVTTVEEHVETLKKRHGISFSHSLERL